MALYCVVLYKMARMIAFPFVCLFIVQTVDTIAIQLPLQKCRTHWILKKMCNFYSDLLMHWLARRFSFFSFPSRAQTLFSSSFKWLNVAQPEITTYFCLLFKSQSL